MDSVEDSVPENLKCPICFLLPKGKVLQCKDGHIICEDCYKSVKNCPQCRVVFNSEEIRNRLLESMLDDLKLACPFKVHGCNEMLSRHTLESHIENCTYDKTRSAINLCGIVGYSDCSFSVKEEEVSAAIKHLALVHQFVIEKSEVVKMEYCHSADVLKGTVNRNSDTPSQKVVLWKPLVITNAEKSFAVVLLTIHNILEKTVCWIPVGIGCRNGSQIKFYNEVNTDTVTQKGDGPIFLKWSADITSLTNARKALEKLNYLRIMTSQLDKNCNEEGSLFLNCKLKLGVDKADAVDGDPVQSAICLMPQLSNLDVKTPRRRAPNNTQIQTYAAILPRELPRVQEVKWISPEVCSWPKNAVNAGGSSGGAFYVARSHTKFGIIPGYILEGQTFCRATFNGSSVGSNVPCQILTASPNTLTWKEAQHGEIPRGAFKAGSNFKSFRTYYIGRVFMGNGFICGHVDPFRGMCFIQLDDKEWTFQDYEVLAWL